MRWTGRAMVLAGMLLAAAATAQERGADSGGGGRARTPAPAARPGTAPLQTEPGDIWAEVRSWPDGARRRPAPAEPPRRRNPASPPER
jgi:hypothetical protein